ncbi:secreted immunoglobulin domain 1 isoform X1 [Silurus meridionalis]|nr:secreted immunoglobulin domain 1 isoform X1 [Silurus meridionalis]
MSPCRPEVYKKLGVREIIGVKQTVHPLPHTIQSEELEMIIKVALVFFFGTALHCLLWRTSTCISVKKGQNVTLSCPLKIKENIGAVTWYKQNSGEGVNLLLNYNLTVPPHVRYAAGVNKHRYVVLHRNRNRVRPRLRILNVEEIDTATYYCGYSEKPQEQKDISGKPE